MMGKEKITMKNEMIAISETLYENIKNLEYKQALAALEIAKILYEAKQCNSDNYTPSLFSGRSVTNE